MHNQNNYSAKKLGLKEYLNFETALVNISIHNKMLYVHSG